MTKNMGIDESGKMTHPYSRSRFPKIGYQNGKYEPVVALVYDVIRIKPDKREEFKKHLHTLTASCVEQVIQWKSKQEAWEWLKSSIMKFGFAKYSVETDNGSYFPKEIKEVTLNGCDVLITYNLYKGGWDNTFEGTLTERIPLKAYRLSDAQQNLQNDENNSQPVITVINSKETKPTKTFMSVTKFAAYSDTFVQNIENVLVYLSANCR